VSGSQPGLRIQQVKGAGQPTASQSFLYTAERRDRTIYFSALRIAAAALDIAIQEVSVDCIQDDLRNLSARRVVKKSELRSAMQ